MVDLHHHVLGSLAARTRYEIFVVFIADDRRTLCGTIAHGVFETNAMQEALHLLVEGSTTDDNLVEVASEGLCHLFAYLLAHLLADDRHVEKHTHAVVLNLGEHLLADNLLDDEWHGNDDGWLDAAESLGDDSRTWYAGEEEDVATGKNLEEELERHAIHVSQWKNADDRVASLDLLGQYTHSKVEVAPECTVRHHDTLGEACSTTGVVDERYLVWVLLNIIMYVFLAEILRELDTEHLVEMLACIGEFVGT